MEFQTAVLNVITPYDSVSSGFSLSKRVTCSEHAKQGECSFQEHRT